MSKRILLKISGEGLAPEQGFGLCRETLERVAREVKTLVDARFQVAIVVGGGNIVRGGKEAGRLGIDEATAHYMGMLGTVINALALRDIFEQVDQPTRVQSAIPIQAVCESYIYRRCLRHMEKGRVVIVAGGTGRPFVTTDTAAALVASEIQAEILIKGTQVDGVYSADPKTNPSAVRHEQISHDAVIDRRLSVMDLSAIDLCKRNRIPIIVLDLKESGNLLAAARGQLVGTRIS